MENSAGPPAPSHVWPLVVRVKAALLLTSGSAESASIVPTIVAAVECSRSEESEHPFPTRCLQGLVGFVPGLKDRMRQLVSIVPNMFFGKGSNVITL